MQVAPPHQPHTRFTFQGKWGFVWQGVVGRGYRGVGGGCVHYCDHPDALAMWIIITQVGHFHGEGICPQLILMIVDITDGCILY